MVEDDKHCDNCRFWKGRNDKLRTVTGEVMDSEPTDGWCEKHSKRTDNIDYCSDYEPKDEQKQ